jgi:hypothetical protein
MSVVARVPSGVEVSSYWRYSEDLELTKRYCFWVVGER